MVISTIHILLLVIVKILSFLFKNDLISFHLISLFIVEITLRKHIFINIYYLSINAIALINKLKNSLFVI